MNKYLSSIKTFLTQNTSSKQTVIKNTFWLLLAEGISKGSLAVLIIMIGRIFGKEVFGQYSYLSVILTFLVVFADLGITQLAIRDYQHIDEKHRRQYLVTGLWTKGLLSIAVTAVYIGILWFTADTSFLRLIGLILLTNNLTNSFLEYIRSTFRSLQKGETELRIKFIQGVGNLLLIPLLYIYQSLPLNLLGQSIVTIITIGYARRLVRKRQLQTHEPEVMVTKGQLISNGWMFAISGLSVMLYFYVDTLIIKHYFGFQEVGLYNAAYRVSTMLTIPASILMSTLTVDFNSAFRAKSPIFKKVIQGFFMCFAGTVALFILGTFFASDIILALYGVGFVGSVAPLQYLIYASALIYLNCGLTAIYMAFYKEKVYMGVSIAALVFNVCMNFILVPIYGIIGSAYTTLMTESLVLLLLTLFVVLYYRGWMYEKS